MSHLTYYNYEGYGQKAQKDFGYSQAVRVGDIIECSGQGGWDRTTSQIPSDITAQIEQAFENCAETLRTAGASFKDVFAIKSYHVGVSDDVVEIMVRCVKRFCGGHQPVWTLVGVASLAWEEMKVEIDVRAHVPVEGK
ncbi:endoribonuclease-like protein L-psp [Mollisia scopiformis]|uniref:Endoribonuclease-like protein L-psp n=1 Tax=Mollisia scopiformis TaxID=149040 RepID=A0A194X327_MOLSC|nr:endoribonuclease-like protein L-psp [Mollisia scopiformis]KUJ14424.1 endoribonuclease-like protein L-psp [Mollisia scopiformis]